MRLAEIISSLIAALYLIAVPVWMNYLIRQTPCRSVSINLKELPEYNLVTEKELFNLVSKTIPGLSGKKIKDVKVLDVEEAVRKLREVKVAEAYFIVDGTLCVYVVQRNPILRVIVRDGDYFLDDEGLLIPRRKIETPRLHVAIGNITITSKMLNGVSVLDTSIRRSILKDIHYLVNYVRNDRFWSAQIDQIWVDSKNKINLIPRTGNHIVTIGNIEDLDEKLYNLGEFYRQVLPLAGWDTYKTINLEYKNQIVCTKIR